MRPLAAHGALLRSAGFVEVALEDLSDWYRREARGEWERMQGPLYPVMVEGLGQAGAEHFVENWKAMVAVLDLGELRPGRYRARKPEVP
jgi:phosphoethanolamine N-methyltransferase